MSDGKRQSTQKWASTCNCQVKPCVCMKRADSLILDYPTERPMFNSNLMEDICKRENLQAALKRVRRNKGAPGIDEMTVDALGAYLKTNWLEIKAQLLRGNYQPQPVKRIEIPKPNGKGTRKLGIPCVLDRFIQQAILQVLQRTWDRKFSANSFGFRPGRSAHQAISRAQNYIKSGYNYVVDLDLEKFFDRVNHDRLMSKLATEIEDKRALKLIRSYLNAGIMEHGLVKPLTEGVSQGGPLSPFLSNVVLDELDNELEKRAHKYVRYGDDCNIYVRSIRSGERVFSSISNFITKRLKLKVNMDKSAVDLPHKRGFLGFSFTGGKRVARRKIAPTSLKRFRARVRQITRRNRGRSIESVVAELSKYLIGWRGYFGFCETEATLIKLDSWIRRRIRCVYWKQWKTYRNRKHELITRGVGEDLAHVTAWCCSYRLWKGSNTPGTRIALNNKYLKGLGIPSLVRDKY